MQTIQTKRIRTLAKEQGISLNFICKKIGVAAPYFLDIEKGNRIIPDDKINQIAKILHTTAAHLNGETDDPAPRLPLNMRPLTDSTVARIPIVSTVRAGFGGVPEPVYDGTMAVYDRKNPQEYVWMKVEGDSMSPDIKNGDYVLVHIQPTAENGDIVVAIWNGEEGTVKKYQSDENGIMLIPLNTQYPAHFIANAQLGEFIIYGVVKETKRILG